LHFSQLLLFRAWSSGNIKQLTIPFVVPVMLTPYCSKVVVVDEKAP